MREIIIAKIKELINWRNENYSWMENFVPEEFPDFEKETDKALFEIYENIPKGPCG